MIRKKNKKKKNVLKTRVVVLAPDTTVRFLVDGRGGPPVCCGSRRGTCVRSRAVFGYRFSGGTVEDLRVNDGRTQTDQNQRSSGPTRHKRTRAPRTIAHTHTHTRPRPRARARPRTHRLPATPHLRLPNVAIVWVRGSHAFAYACVTRRGAASFFSPPVFHGFFFFFFAFSLCAPSVTRVRHVDRKHRVTLLRSCIKRFAWPAYEILWNIRFTPATVYSERGLKINFRISQQGHCFPPPPSRYLSIRPSNWIFFFSGFCYIPCVSKFIS